METVVYTTEILKVSVKICFSLTFPVNTANQKPNFLLEQIICFFFIFTSILYNFFLVDSISFDRID